MSSLALFILVFVASRIVFVDSQEDQRCSDLKPCKKGCCYEGRCTTDSTEESLCRLLAKEKRRLYELERQCYSDFSCTDGCCINNQCESKLSYECTEKNTCTTNSDCDSGCCKDNQCQESFADCIVFVPPTFKIDECYSSANCHTSDRSCCVDGSCRTCPQDHDYGGSSSDSSSSDSSSSDSSSSAGTIIGIVIAVITIVLVILKIARWAARCSSHQRRRVVVVRRRVTVVAAPLVDNDELQREHERAEQEPPDCPPPAYSPTAELGEGASQHTGQTPDEDEGEWGIVNGSEDYGVQQGSPMAPPSAYSLSPAANSSENGNSVETDQTQRGGVIGNSEDVNGVPEGSIMVPPPASYPPENTTGNNSLHADLT